MIDARNHGHGDSWGFLACLCRHLELLGVARRELPVECSLQHENRLIDTGNQLGGIEGQEALEIRRVGLARTCGVTATPSHPRPLMTAS